MGFSGRGFVAIQPESAEHRWLRAIVDYRMEDFAGARTKMVDSQIRTVDVTDYGILSAMGEGFQRGNQAVLEELGKNIVVIRNGRTSVQAGGERAGRVIRLNIGDVYELQNKSRLIEYLSPELMRGSVSIKSAYNAAALQMSGSHTSTCLS